MLLYQRTGDTFGGSIEEVRLRPASGVSILLLAFLLIGLPSSVAMAEDGSRPITLRQVLELAVEQNPDIRAAGLDVELAGQAIRIADGSFDVTIHYEDGMKTRVEEDTDASGKADTVTFYRRGEEIVPRAGVGFNELMTWIAACAAHMAAGGEAPQLAVYADTLEYGIGFGMVHAENLSFGFHRHHGAAKNEVLYFKGIGRVEI